MHLLQQRFSIRNRLTNGDKCIVGVAAINKKRKQEYNFATLSSTCMHTTYRHVNARLELAV